MQMHAVFLRAGRRRWRLSPRLRLLLRLWLPLRLSPRLWLLLRLRLPLRLSPRLRQLLRWRLRLLLLWLVAGGCGLHMQAAVAVVVGGCGSWWLGGWVAGWMEPVRITN